MIPLGVNNMKDLLLVPFCLDFEVTGEGDHSEWEKAEWIDMQKLDYDGKEYKSRFKALYSVNGIYVLFYGEDHLISSPSNNDVDKIFKGDVFEIFFLPDINDSLYFEYEISPLNKELVLLMVKKEDSLSGWNPWPYEKQTWIKKEVCVHGGEIKPHAKIKLWTAELFIPNMLLSVFNNTPPIKGTIWHANFCRLDYDTGNIIKWAWAPVENSFHELERYFTLLFG